jgi:hypothetical protein
MTSSVKKTILNGVIVAPPQVQFIGSKPITTIPVMTTEHLKDPNSKQEQTVKEIHQVSFDTIHPQHLAHLRPSQRVAVECLFKQTELLMLRRNS